MCTLTLRGWSQKFLRCFCPAYSYLQWLVFHVWLVVCWHGWVCEDSWVQAARAGYTEQEYEPAMPTRDSLCPHPWLFPLGVKGVGKHCSLFSMLQAPLGCLRHANMPCLGDLGWDGAMLNIFLHFLLRGARKKESKVSLYFRELSNTSYIG